MQTARLFVALSALMLGSSLMATASARADASAHHVPAGVQPRWRAHDSGHEAACPVQASALSFDMPASVYIDPVTGAEIYLPTGETIDHVLPVVATRLPAVASVGSVGPKIEPSCESCTWAYYGGGAGFLLGLGLLGRFVARRRLASSRARGSSPGVHTGFML